MQPAEASRVGPVGAGTAAVAHAWRLDLDRVSLGLLVLGLVLVLLTFRGYGVTWDEPGLRTYGQMLVDWYRSGFTDARVFAFANLRYYGGAFDILATLLEPWTPLGPYHLRHLLGGLVGLLGLALTWRLARRLGGPRAGLMALLLLATLPGWWGHMFFNSKDVPFAVGMLGSLLVWLRCLEEWPRPRLATTLLLGLAVGLTLGVRIGGVVMIVWFALPLTMVTLSHARGSGPRRALGELGRGLVRLLPALPALIVVLVPVWPWVALAPGNLFEALAYLSHFPYTADTIFAGQRYPAPAVPALYWPTLLVLQLTEVILAGLVAALLLLPGSSPSLGERRRLALLALLGAALFPLAYAVLARPTAYNNLRHFIFVLPPLVVLAALGLDRLLARLPGRAATTATAAILAGLLMPLARTAQLHPYEYVYFNDLSGGVKAAQGRFELDYWGTSFGELGRLVEAKLAQRPTAFGLLPVPVRVCGPFETSQEVLPPSLLPVYHTAPARLAVAIAIFFCVDPPPGGEVARVERLGVVLSRAYEAPPDAVITSFTKR